MDNSEGQFVCLFFFETGSHRVALAGLKLVMLTRVASHQNCLPLPFEYYNQKHASSWLARPVYFNSL